MLVEFEIINQVENKEQENENADDGNEESEEIKKQKLLVQYLEVCLCSSFFCLKFLSNPPYLSG